MHGVGAVPARTNRVVVGMVGSAASELDLESARNVPVGSGLLRGAAGNGAWSRQTPAVTLTYE